MVVPFGGAEHDWAALELGARIAANRSIARLVGAAARLATGERDASQAARHALCSTADGRGRCPTGACQPGHLVAATVGAGLLVVGLSDRFPAKEGRAMRTELAISRRLRFCSFDAARGGCPRHRAGGTLSGRA